MAREALDPQGAMTRNVKGPDGGEVPLWKALFDASDYKSPGRPSSPKS
jgi:hypothetical protein